MPRPKIAAVVTEHRERSHAQHFVDRFLWGYPWHGRHHLPPMDLVALYTDQVPKGDLSRDRARRFPAMKIYPTIAAALTLGGEKLAVDGVLLIGEHGDYPRNEKGQTRWPRYEFFQQIVDVYRSSGRSVPVFSDKHLSWKWEWAREMVETSREMQFPFMAGSSIPYVQRLPPVEIPRDAEVEEVVCVAPGGVDGYDIHALEGIQAMVERRKGGEKGVQWLHALRRDAVFQAMGKGGWDRGGWDPELFEACLCRSHSIAAGRPAFGHALPERDEIPALLNEEAIAYRFQYADGLKATMLLLEGLVHDFTFAARIEGQQDPLSTLMYVDGRRPRHFFNAQVNAVEEMFLTGKAICPIERTLLTTGLTAAGVESLWIGQRIDTPHLEIHYEPTAKSTFWNG